ncbi:MAG: hypothetical protein B7Z55_13170, partial [Planctomycetales bacterium 12-60-4]
MTSHASDPTKIVEDDTALVAPVVQELLPAPSVMNAVRSLADLPRLLLLDSAVFHSERGRYSFLMADPCEQAEWNAPDLKCDPFAALRQWS